MLREPRRWWCWWLPLMTLVLMTAPHDLRDPSSPGNAARKRGKDAPPKGTHWWALASLGRERTNALRTSVSRVYTNTRLLPLSRRQRKLVARNPGSLLAVARGARMAIEECQFQFRRSRWNCPTFVEDGASSVFGKIVHRGTRETAFIYAVTSAAVSHTVARACSQGAIQTCTCDYSQRKRGRWQQQQQQQTHQRQGHLKVPHDKPHSRDSRGEVSGNSAGGGGGVGGGASEKEWEWSGCNDNIRFGNRFSRRFVDGVERGRDFRYLMNLHNNRAGRVHLQKEMQRECKCHGMSGSCSMRTCWVRLPSFRLVGHLLKDRYDGATLVLPGNEGNMRLVQGRKSSRSSSSSSKSRNGVVLQPVDPSHKTPGRRDLVYFQNSPTFCQPDASIGFPGTQGRQCNVSSMGMDGCDLMCCGRGFSSQTTVVRQRCSCTFHWCCQVSCKVCSVNQVHHTCD